MPDAEQNPNLSDLLRRAVARIAAEAAAIHAMDADALAAWLDGGERAAPNVELTEREVDVLTAVVELQRRDRLTSVNQQQVIAFSGYSAPSVSSFLRVLQVAGFVERITSNKWRATSRGKLKSQNAF